jgi:hypothetical protein
MLGRIRRNLTFANVCSFIALTVAVSTGGAYAANTVFSTDIVDGQVMNVDLAANAVSTTKLTNSSVNSAKIGPDTILAEDIAPEAVGVAEIADDTIGGSNVIDASLSGTDIAGGSLTGTDIAADSVFGSDLADNTVGLADIIGANRSGQVSVSSIASGRCTTIDGSVSGAAVGELALLAVTGGTLPSGVTFMAQGVTSAGHVAIKVCNGTGASWSGATDLPVRVATFG